MKTDEKFLTGTARNVWPTILKVEGGRKHFTYAIEMNEIFGKRKHINPAILLSTKKHEIENKENIPNIIEES